MEPRTTPFEYVFASAARRETLATLAANPVDRRTVVDRLEASESAVYDAFSGLAERGLIVRDGSQWRVTGMGRAVADCLERCRLVDETLLEGPAFWQAHDLDGLPRAVRMALLEAPAPAFATPHDDRSSGDVLAAHVADARAETVDAVVGDVDRSLLQGLARLEDGRVVGDRSTLESGLSLEGEGMGPSGPGEGVGARLRACASAAPSATVLVTDEDVAIALPALGKQFGDKGIVIVDDETVRRRCRAYVDRLWQRGTPLGNPASSVAPQG